MIAATLELHVLSYAGGEAERGQSVLLGHSPVSIGRSPACHLSLDDAERLISRSHVSAWLDAHGKAWVRNASSSTPVFVEGLELAPGAQTGIQAGQTLVLGRYLLGVRRAEMAPEPVAGLSMPAAATIGSAAEWGGGAAQFSSIPDEFDVFAAPVDTGTASGGSMTSCGLGEFSGDSAALSEVFDALPAFDARGPQQAPELLDLVRGGGLDRSTADPDPLKQLLGESSLLLDTAGGSAADSSAGSEHGEEIDGLFRMPVAASAIDLGSMLGVADAAPANSAPPMQVTAGPLDPLALDLGQNDSTTSAAGQSLLDLIGDSGSEHVASGPPPLPAANVSRAPSPSPSSMTVPGPAVASVKGVLVPDALPRVEVEAHAEVGAGSPMRPSADAAAPMLPVSTPVAAAPAAAISTPKAQAAMSVRRESVPVASEATSSGAESSDLMAAFARGCGLHPAQLGTLDEGAMETLGQLFQSLVAGTLQLIHARSSTKDELRAHMTIIATSGNNPLKFAPDAQAAMLQLVGRGLPGFMPPVEAVRDAFSDLSAHQVGLLAASRSAMYAMAGRLSPEHIQQRVGGPRGFSGLLPSAHKAQLWDAFVAAHTQLLGEAREEFDAAFQGAFVDAYEGEVRRVQSGIAS